MNQNTEATLLKDMLLTTLEAQMLTAARILPMASVEEKKSQRDIAFSTIGMTTLLRNGNDVSSDFVIRVNQIENDAVAIVQKFEEIQ